MSSTVRDIAKRANVSPATVSRVLNNYSYVNETTRQAVVKAALELKYPLDRVNQPQPTTQTVLLLTLKTDTLEEATTSRDNTDTMIARGASAYFTQKDFDVRLHNSRHDPAEIDGFQQSGVCGLILLGGVHSPEFITQLQAKGLPFVLAGGHALPLHVNCVMANIVHGMDQAVSHLVMRNRQHIGLVNGPDNTRTSLEKYKGLRLALSLHELPFETDQVIRGDFTAMAGYAQTFVLLRQRPDLDAIIYTDDTCALGGLKALKELGYRVPDDISVVGFHDYELSSFCEPPLTTVRFDMNLMGTIASKRLYTMLQDPDDHDTWMTLVETSLVVRGSA